MKNSAIQIKTQQNGATIHVKTGPTKFDSDWFMTCAGTSK